MNPMNTNQESFIASLLPDSDKKMARIAGASLVVALSLGFWASTYERIIDDIIFDDPPQHKMDVSVSISTPPPPPPPPKEKKVDQKHIDKVAENLTRHTKAGNSKPSNNKGKPNVAKKMGVLGIIAAMTDDASQSAYDLFDRKFTNDIDRTLSQIDEFRDRGKTNIGAVRGKVDGTFNAEHFAGGSGGIRDLAGGIFGGHGGRISTKAMKGNMKVPSVKDIDMGMGGASRSASDIMKVVKQRTPGLRHIYNKHLKKVPGFEGKVTLKFTIAPGGEIISISLVSSTTGNNAFDSDIKNAISRWTFGVIKSGNTTVTITVTFTE